MALSYYNNWETLQYQQHLNPEMNFFTQTPPELPPEFLCFHENFALSDRCIDPIFEPPAAPDLLNSDKFTSSPYSMPYFKSFTPDFEPYQYPKRPRITYEDDYSDFINLDFENGLVPIPQMPLPEFLPELAVPLIPPEFQTSRATQPVYNLYGSTDAMKGNGNGNANVRTLSVQSIAARERRRKITDKTQELGKLVPGGHKFNTAEMFEAAYKYINFLKAQVGILELMGSMVGSEKPPMHSQGLEYLLASPLVQEKLYMTAKCLVPEQFVQILADDPQVQSMPQVLKEIHQLADE